MFNYICFTYIKNFFLLPQSQIVSILTVVVIFFSILLILGIRKSYKLKKENDRLNEISMLEEEEGEKAYKDFTDGHMYGGNN